VSSILGAVTGAFGGGSIGTASVNLVLNAATYDAQLAEAEAKTTAASTSMEGGLTGALTSVKTALGATGVAAVAVGAAAVAGISKAIGVTTQWADEVRSLQRVTGLSAESASKLTGAAELLGIPIANLVTAFGLLDKNIVNASPNLTKYGIATQDAVGNTLPFDTVLGNIIDKYGTLATQGEKAAFAQNVFGRSGKALIPILDGGRANLAALEEEVQKSGLVMSQGGVDAAKNYSIALRALSDSFKGVMVQIGTAFIPVVTKVVQGFSTLVQGALAFGQKIGAAFAPVLAQLQQAFQQFMQAIQPILPELLKLGSLITEFFVGAALGALIVALKLLVGAFEFVTKVINEVVGAINIFIQALNLVIDASNAVIGTHFKHIDALGSVTTATDSATAATNDSVVAYGAADRAIGSVTESLRGISDVLKGYEHDLTSTTKATATGFLSLQTTVKDTFNVSLAEENRGFSQMLAAATRFRHDMTLLENLKLGLDPHNMAQFEDFMSQQGPGFIDRFVNSSKAKQQQWVAEWQRSTGRVQGTIGDLQTSLDRLNNTRTNIQINTAQIDAAAQKVHGLQAALARGL